MRVVVLWSRLSGYLVECLAQLVSHGVELMTVHWPASSDAPFKFADSDIPGQRFLRTRFRRYRELEEILKKFQPGAALVSGWMDRLYLRAAYGLRRRGCVVVGALDNQWRGRLDQRVKAAGGGWLLSRVFSAVWVPGERSEQFAKRLGFRGVRIWRGFYCGASKEFRQVPEQRKERWVVQRGAWPRRFIFVGRYDPVKGIQELLNAYSVYRQASSRPWELVCVGHGSLKPLVSGAEGVCDLGFVPPRELPSVLADTGCFVLPSRREGWVVALLEATASGLPVICSDQCGSHVELVRDGFNGWVVPSRDEAALAAAMKRMAAMPVEELEKSGDRSAQLAAPYTPERWAQYFLDKYAELKA